jgi:hypothetical protein
MNTKPKLKLTGQNGNAFMILGLAKRAANSAKWSSAEWEDFQTKATAGDYNHLLATTMEYFQVS